MGMAMVAKAMAKARTNYICRMHINLETNSNQPSNAIAQSPLPINAYCLILPIAECLIVLPIACCLSPVACCLLRLLPTAYCPLPTANCILPIAYCLLPIAYCLWPIANCLLPISYGLLPIAYNGLSTMRNINKELATRLSNIPLNNHGCVSFGGVGVLGRHWENTKTTKTI